MSSKFFSWVFPIVFSIIITLPIISAYFHEGYFPTHDGQWAVVRAGEMFRELHDGQFPARMSSNLNYGYGYPLFNFAYPMPYYLATVLHLLRFGFAYSVDILFVGSIICSSLFMFLLGKFVWKRTIAGAVGATLYTYLPYHFVDLFVRGSLGEAISFALFPLLFYLFFKIEQRDKNFKMYTILGALCYAMLITTHNIMAVFFSILLGGFLLVQTIINKKLEIRNSLFLFGGILLSAFFWLPALFEKQYILLSQIPIADRSLYFAKPIQLFLFQWGFNPPTEPGGFSYQIGLPHFIGFLLVVITLLYAKKKDKKVTILSIFAVLFIFMLFAPSQFLWKLPLLSEINYPWTLLLPLGFLFSFLTGYLYIQGKIFRIIVIILACASPILYFQYSGPQYHVKINLENDFYLTNQATTTSSDELMPLWVKEKPKQQAEHLVAFIEGQGEIANVFSNSKKITFSISTGENGIIQINRIYYPGFKAYVNGVEKKISYDNSRGVMQVPIESGMSKVEIVFTETPIRIFADILSIGGIVGILFFMRKRYS